MNIPKFKGACAERNIKVNDLGVLWKCTRQTASSKRNGKAPITLDEAKAFAEYAGLSDEEKVNIFLSEG